ncbi:sensor histidine kinase [Botrimarina hoheduenensis]|uniref:histidine kinase n=1 Tax=Botrimarina hoheduenensis TaxID=2528000 RepID=A0A5C5VNE4_9BACT|nr:ATP-binding protein [Botrimarina hoheduenensis]TWT40144.1 Sensor histidine kinase YycG [Botrimarina hoheduenensis]
MYAKSLPIGLPRRVVSLYLLFSLLAVSLLTAGSYFAAQSLLHNRTTGSGLAQLGRLAAALQLDRIQTGGEDAARLLQATIGGGNYAHAAVVDEAGIYLVHTDPDQVGTVSIEPEGAEILSWGSVGGLRYAGGAGQMLNEYRVPLTVSGLPTHTLRLAVAEPRLTDTLTQYGHYATLAILAPIACLALGVWALRKLTDPLSAIDRELSAIARLGHGMRPEPVGVPSAGLASIGWNRLVQHVHDLSESVPEADFESRLMAASQGDGRTRDALESLAEGVAMTDPEGRIEFANRAIAALLQSDQALEGEALLDLIGRIDPATEETFRQNRCENAVAELPVSVGDESRVLRVARGPLRSRGETPGFVWSVRDITQQKLAEASRDQFINTATHELRTPLANIKAYAETLVTCDFTDVEEQKEFCNTINAEATRLARFVDDLLSISSLEVGTLAIDRQRTDVKRLMDEAAQKVGTLMRSKSLRFEIALGEKLGDAHVDKDKILGMVVNLLGNAAKYTPEGGHVTFAVVRQEDAIKIEVRDTGVGIAPDEQARVFEKFFRSSNPAIREEVGTGLGLPLAREIAQLHRGELTLQSTLGEGSTFTVMLPLQ